LAWLQTVVGEGGAETFGGRGGRPEPVEAEQGGSDHRRRRGLPHRGGRCHLRDPGADPFEEGRVVAPEHPAAEHHVDVVAAEVIEPWGGGKWHMEIFRAVNPEPEDWNGEM